MSRELASPEQRLSPHPRRPPIVCVGHSVVDIRWREVDDVFFSLSTRPGAVETAALEPRALYNIAPSSLEPPSGYPGPE